jgi:rhamnulokinase
MSVVIAVDVGGESGRIFALRLANGKVSSEEVYRFINTPVHLRNTLYWNVLQMWHEVETGLARAMELEPQGIGVDFFGVDFGLLDANGDLLSQPVHMRDHRTEGMMGQVFSRIPREALFNRTGIGFYVINTIYQLVAVRIRAPHLLQNARHLLTMPNLFTYWLTSEIVSEFTHSTTTQCYNPTLQNWDTELLNTLDLPSRIFPPVVAPGQKVGHYNKVPVYTVASHDTASAVAAVPAQTANFAYISSGTWSLVGIETAAPILTAAALHANITNEGGAGNTYRPLKMVMGMWLLQQARALWLSRGVDVGYDSLFDAAQEAQPFSALVDPDDPRFFPPGDMPSRIRAFCKQTGQASPDSVGQIVRCILESLALKYRHVIDQLATVSGQPIEVVHVVGGGAKNSLLCQMTANAAQRPVLAGPAEATALGNGLVQLIAKGELANLAEARQCLRQSMPIVEYQPQDHQQWDDAYGRFRGLITVF